MDGTGTMCVDVDECKISGDSICGAGNCMNTYGSFRCKCDQGYRNDMMMEMCMGKLLELKALLSVSWEHVNVRKYRKC